MNQFDLKNDFWCLSDFSIEIHNPDIKNAPCCICKPNAPVLTFYKNRLDDPRNDGDLLW